MGQKISVSGFVKDLWRIMKGKPQVPPSLKNNLLLTTILNRRSVRSFSTQEIPAEVFSAILEAGRLAPSTVNLQTWSFGVFTPDQWRASFDSMLPFKGNKAVMIMADMHRTRQVPLSFPSSPLVEYTIAVMNASLAAMNMNIAAEALGVSSVMLSETGRSGLLDISFLKEKLQLPEGVIPLMTMVFGYARSLRPPMPPKLPLEQITFTDFYHEPDLKILNEWLSQMISGYKASHFSSSFDAQLGVYQSKIGKAEEELMGMIHLDKTE